MTSQRTFFHFNFSSRVKKYFIRSLRSLLKYFSTLEEKFHISRGQVIFSIYYLLVLVVQTPQISGVS